MKNNTTPKPAPVNPDIDTSLEHFVLQVGTPQRQKPSYRINVAQQLRDCDNEQRQRAIQASAYARQLPNGLVKVMNGSTVHHVSIADAVRAVLKGDATFVD